MKPSRPLGSKVLLRLLPERRKEGRIFLPDEDTMKFCVRCGGFAEGLDSPCKGDPEFALNEKTDRYVRLGTDYSHDVQIVARDVVAEQSRQAEVLACGKAVRDVKVGMRVLVRFDSGEGDEVRLVEEGAIMGVVEEGT